MAPQADQHSGNPVNRAFSKQSGNYDDDDRRNPVLTEMRGQVYAHADRYLAAGNFILELNAGTGIDAHRFASAGYSVLATDLSDGMISEIRKKVSVFSGAGSLEAIQVSYDHLETLAGRKFDFVFSNFGGLNCIADLSAVTKGLPPLLNPGAHVTWVIMPPVYFWEWLGIFKGRLGTAFRRLQKNGVMAHLEGEYFKTYYHSLSSIREAFGGEFDFVESEALCLVSPPPHRPDFPKRHPALYKLLRRIDHTLGSMFPFNRTGDHLIVTFRRK